MLAVIRIKGELHLRPEKKRTLELLRLYRINHLVLVNETEEMKKMLKKIEELITFGEITQEALEVLLEKRARIMGDKKLDAAFLKKHKFSSIKELAKAILEKKARLKDLGIKQVFRLRAPIKGFERAGIKKSYSVGGAWGYRAHDINALIERMA